MATVPKCWRRTIDKHYLISATDFFDCVAYVITEQQLCVVPENKILHTFFLINLFITNQPPNTGTIITGIPIRKSCNAAYRLPVMSTIRRKFRLSDNLQLWQGAESAMLSRISPQWFRQKSKQCRFKDYWWQSHQRGGSLLYDFISDGSIVIQS